MSHLNNYPGYYTGHRDQPAPAYGQRYGPPPVAKRYDPHSYDPYASRSANETSSERLGYSSTDGYYQDHRRYHTPPVLSQPRAPSHQGPSSHQGPASPSHSASPMKSTWTTGLCECAQDPKSCVCTLCCEPCYTCYLLQEDFEESCWAGCCLSLVGQLVWLPVRYKFRERHNIEGSLIEDCCVTTFCGLCAICQLKREKDSISEPSPQDPSRRTLNKHMQDRAGLYRYPATIA